MDSTGCFRPCQLRSPARSPPRRAFSQRASETKPENTTPDLTRDQLATLHTIRVAHQNLSSTTDNGATSTRTHPGRTHLSRTRQSPGDCEDPRAAAGVRSSRLATVTVWSFADSRPGQATAGESAPLQRGRARRRPHSRAPDLTAAGDDRRRAVWAPPPPPPPRHATPPPPPPPTATAAAAATATAAATAAATATAAASRTFLVPGAGLRAARGGEWRPRAAGGIGAGLPGPWPAGGRAGADSRSAGGPSCASCPW